MKSSPKYTKLLIIITFVVVSLSLFLAYFNTRLLNLDEPILIDDYSKPQTHTIEAETLTGYITYIDPRNYPSDNISHYLADSEGKIIILLSPKNKRDASLEVADGLYADVVGIREKTADKENDVLKVEEIVIHAVN